MIFLAVSSAAVALILFAKCKVTPPSMRKQLSARFEEIVHGPFHRIRQCNRDEKGMVAMKLGIYMERFNNVDMNCQFRTSTSMNSPSVLCMSVGRDSTPIHSSTSSPSCCSFDGSNDLGRNDI